jgi:chloramphenicol-sensitive protein RarD
VRTPSPVLAGTLSAVVAYALWGFFPFYFKAVSDIPALQVLAHRVIWSLVLLGVVVALAGRWSHVLGVAGDRRCLLKLSLSATAIAVNWGVFIWAVDHQRVLECSLGYFVAPLVSVLMGIVVLGERLGRLQWLAVVLAAVGVVHQVVAFGTLPWVALVLAFSFAVYGLLRKLTPVDAVGGLLIEAFVLTPAAVAYLVAVGIGGEGAFGRYGWEQDLLLVLAGPVTALPLILFVTATRRIRLASIGLLQYITPTGHFLLAVFVFGERFAPASLLTFLLIWTALLIYSADTVRRLSARFASRPFVLSRPQDDDRAGFDR